MAFENLQPKEVFHFFEEICNIPHGSGNLQKISDYLVSFAKERGIEVRQDEELNVIMKAPASAGYEDREPVILQGHMDMVAVKEDSSDIDMVTDGLRVKTDGEFVWADGTSLGGDDGIAVAYCLALLDSKDIPHPPLEVVITTNEETGMFGATAIDLSDLKGKKLINIDNEEEGAFIVSCAGGARVCSKLPVKRQAGSGKRYKVEVSGLKGGHSGEMIKCGRGNANIILARTLMEALDSAKFNLETMEGGVADNAIPNVSFAVVTMDGSEADKFKASVAATLSDIRGELEVKDPGLNIEVKELGDSTAPVITAEDTFKALSMICMMPDGVQAMSSSVEGLVETSLNLGVLKTTDDMVETDQSVRSSVESSKDYLIRKVKMVSTGLGAEVSVSGSYPGWKYRQQSELRDHMVAVYKKMYGVEPRVEAIHAGLECGILSKKIDDLDCISIGPDMQDIHSTKEKLSVKSVSNVWDYLKEVLK
ncbi:aminoacyl-histidine dipeptidase [Butyrivibrio sp. CB08]|uniref:aminoacyl-histidine dipeptidase n=1 Tax=Butyrivibrio sp. CB08 TaxID=2364879 RepID=UPI000EA8B626|nr:aminoacyl-histidine dipeptidase [Butyrivibrio sp. CB08]RKM61974.1 aminoacyl-histidine dipeptidase [Butyrivibrio sp. CB08]